MRISTNPLVNGPVWAFTYFFRGTPLLVQMFLLYYGLGQMQFMIDLSQSLTFLKDAYWYALVAFTLNTCAYTTEIFRGDRKSTRLTSRHKCASRMPHSTR